jgi:hypothetical protein
MSLSSQRLYFGLNYYSQYYKTLVFDRNKLECFSGIIFLVKVQVFHKKMYKVLIKEGSCLPLTGPC